MGARGAELVVGCTCTEVGGIVVVGYGICDHIHNMCDD